MLLSMRRILPKLGRVVLSAFASTLELESEQVQSIQGKTWSNYLPVWGPKDTYSIRSSIISSFQKRVIKLVSLQFSNAVSRTNIGVRKYVIDQFAS